MIKLIVDIIAALALLYVYYIMCYSIYMLIVHLLKYLMPQTRNENEPTTRNFETQEYVRGIYGGTTKIE